MSPADDVDPDLFFGEPGARRRAGWKLQQLCKQVEHVAALALAEIDGLVGAAVVEVVPAPDATRLRVVVALSPGSDARQHADACGALARGMGALRSEVARAIHRKRVPEVTFEVRFSEEVEIG